MQDRATDLLPAGSAGEDVGDGAYEHVRERVQALISAARDLSDTCADLADALRPLPGHDDASGHDFGRLRAERTAALLDEAASAARGTLGLLHSAYSALERQVGRPPVREPVPGPRSEVSTWPDAFVELPPRTFTVEDEAGTVPAARWAEPAPSVLPVDGPAPDEVGEEDAGPPVEARYGTGRDEDLGAAAPDPSLGVDAGDSGADRFEAVPVEAGSGTAGLGDLGDLGQDGDDREADQGTNAGRDDGRDDGRDAERHGGDWHAGRHDGADLGHIDPHDADLGDADLDLPYPRDGGRHDGADLDAADPHDAESGHDDPVHTDRRRADLGHTDPHDADLGHTDLRDTDLRDTDPRDTDPRDTDPRDTDPRDTDLAHTDPGAADLMAADERDDDQPDSDSSDLRADDDGTDEDRYGTSPAGGDREAVASAAFAGWVALDPDDEDAGGQPILGRFEPGLPWHLPDRDEDPLAARAVAAEQPAPPRLTLPVDPHSNDGRGWHGDTVSPEPRSLSLVPPVPEPDPDLDLTPTGPPEPTEPTPPRWYLPDPPPWRDEASDAMPAPDAEPWAADPRPIWQPVAGLASHPVWRAEAVPGVPDLPGAGDGLPAYPLDTVDGPAPDAAEVGGDADVPLGQGSPAPIGSPLDDPGAAVIARQVEAARRHLQAALVVANQPAQAPQLGALLTAVERVLTAVTDLARETRGVLESGLTERTFPGEARFLCSQPWERTELVGRDAYGDDVASPSGLAKLLRTLGYEANSVTSAGGVAGVQVRSERYAAHVALVEVAGGGRQRWSGALEWTDASGASRTWAETLGPVELEDEELARRVDELLRRCVGAMH